MAGSPQDLVSQTTYVGMRFDQGGPKEITNEFATQQDAAVAIQAYAKNVGMDARDIYFYVVQKTLTFTPLSRTRFTINTVSERYTP